MFLYTYCSWGQTWDLSKILHHRIFRPKILHPYFYRISTVLVIRTPKNEWKWRHSKNLLCRRQWRQWQISPLLSNISCKSIEIPVSFVVLILCVSKLFLPLAKWRVAKRAMQCGLKILILSANSDSLRLEVKDKYSLSAADRQGGPDWMYFLARSFRIEFFFASSQILCHDMMIIIWRRVDEHRWARWHVLRKYMVYMV